MQANNQKKLVETIPQDIDADLLVGNGNRNLNRIAAATGVSITVEPGDVSTVLSISGGNAGKRRAARDIIREATDMIRSAGSMSERSLDKIIALKAGQSQTGSQQGPAAGRSGPQASGPFNDAALVMKNKRVIEPRNQSQADYLESIKTSEVIFGIGPAGTGKTYLAIAAAMHMFENDDTIKKIILVRPAVEAGEKLGFLPGDLKEKIDPYMQPLYDALYDVRERQSVVNLMKDGTIEVAPLAYMRGRTLKNAIVILDEAQNTTSEQMKMFLTRMGEGSKLIITGDDSQIDLPKGTVSGLVEALEKMQGVEGLAIHKFDSSDIVRHPMVTRMVKAYERFEPK